MFKYKSMYALGVIGLLGATMATASKNGMPAGMVVNKDVKHDVSLPLRYLQALPHSQLSAHPSIKKMIAEETLSLPPTKPVASLLVPLAGFQGMGVGLGNYQVTSPKPDTNSSVGMIQVVQYVNSDLAVFNKATGQVAPGFPKASAAIWAGFNSICETQAAGPMTIDYDHLANRWVIGQYATADINGPFYYCIAVSTGEDATGSYNRYAYQFNSLSDTAQLGLWPDAYYASFNMLGPVINGPIVCAFERDKMIAGLPASDICIQITNLQSGPLMPGNLIGSVSPTVGQPGYYMGLFPPSSLLVFKFHVDFVNPNQSNISQVVIPVATYTPACVGTNGTQCAIQPNTTNQLDIVSDRLMTKLAYRQFSSHGSFVTTHTVQGPAPDNSPAIRWYELRVLSGSPTFNPIVYQQATFAPDSMNRFTGSASIDRFTNIAIGYTVTSSLIHPSMELAYHNYTDGLNNLTIQPLVTGLGSQVDNISAWSSSSKMVIDPFDECTFWYTNEYLKTTGSMNWSTFIINFKLAACNADT